MDAPDVSLVVCTRNRADRLQTCLQYLAEQRPSCSWELVIVDNGSTDSTATVLADFAARAPFPVIMLSERIPGLGRARNTGWTAARGELIAFTDDDCYLGEGFIDSVRAAFDDPAVGFIGGRIELFDPADYPITIKTDRRPSRLAPRSFVPAGAFQGANMAFRRRVLEAIGGFDRGFGAGTGFACQDVDAQARASFAGWWALYTPDAVVAHHHGRKAEAAAALKRTYAIGRGAYMAKFLLNAETRSVYARNFYWAVRRAVLGSPASRREIAWELQGALGYLANCLRRRLPFGRFGGVGNE
jgi:glycosyltransferase involved in cell wall biosynthesis